MSGFEEDLVEEGQEEDDNYEDHGDNGGDEYEYAYEEEETLPSLRREVSESHFEIPHGEYLIIQYTEIAPMMDKLIQEVSTLLGVSLGVAELLLRSTKWNQNLVAEKYYNNEKRILVAAGVIPENEESKNDSNHECMICFDTIQPGDGRSLCCGHECCRYHRSMTFDNFNLQFY